MTLELATAFAGQLVTQLEPNVLKVQVAGEVRRKVEEVESISLVIIPRAGCPFMERGNMVVLNGGIGGEEHLWKIGGVLCRPMGGSRSHAKMQTVEDGIRIDVWIARMHSYAPTFTPGNFGSVMLFATGPDEHINHITSRARHLGMTWEWYSGIGNDSGDIIAGETEKEIYSTLKLDFVEPEDRK